MRAHPAKTPRAAVLLLVCLACFSACKKAAHLGGASKAEVPFAQTDFSEVTAMSDGSAYAVSFEMKLYYLRGNKAVLVSLAGNPSGHPPELSDITPLVDGSAYAISSEKQSRLWYLSADHAEPVTECLTNMPPLPSVSENSFRALYLFEHQKRKRAEYREPPEPPEDPRL